MMNEFIQNGGFGYNGPMGSPNNAIPIGSIGYNYPYQQQPIYQPVMYNQPMYDYNNPFGPPIQQPQQPNNYYNYMPQYYGGYDYNNPAYFSMAYRQQVIEEQARLHKQKFKLICAANGKEYSDDLYNNIFNPKPPTQEMSQKQIEIEMHQRDVQMLSYWCNNQDKIYNPDLAHANAINEYMRNFYDNLNSHSLCEFIENDYPRLRRELWICENVKMDNSRDLSGVYSSQDYNDILSMHRSSNPYINNILSQSKYDNNIDDVEIGLAAVYDEERRRRNALTPKIPEYISSPEVQEQRRLFTQTLMDQIYEKDVKRHEQG